MTGNKDRTRNQKVYESDHLYNEEELETFVDEVRAIDNDSNIVKYVSPTIDELKKIISIAESYDGDWYHSNVVLSGKPESAEKEVLKKKIVELGEEHGIYYLFEF